MITGMLLVITDMDGTLLDAAYSYEAARPALNRLKSLQIPLVLCTSKTRAEVEMWRQRLDNRHPFIVENGGALYIPEDYFPQGIKSPLHRGGYAVIEIGSSYQELVQSLHKASAESECAVRGFHQMSAAEINVSCNIPLETAALAKQREYDEPFEILSGNQGRLLEAIERQKKRWTRGDRFFHILGANDKAHCVNLLCHFYARNFAQVVTVGLGDGLNDANFLNLVDIPLLLESPAVTDLKAAVPRGRLYPSGPRGWNAAILDTLEEHFQASGKDADADFSGGKLPGPGSLPV